MSTVRWEDNAAKEAVQLWLNAAPAMRDAIAAAVKQIDHQLRSDPFAMSESRPGGRRIMFVTPLGVTYRVEADDQTVSILGVWLFRKRSS